MERKIMKTCWKLIAMFAVAMLLVLGGTVRPEMAAEAKAEEIELSSVADSFWNLESGNYKVTSDYISDSNISLNYNAVVTIRVPSGVTLTVPQLSMKEGGSLTLTGGGSIVINGNNPGQGGIGNSASLSIDGVSITVTDSTYSIYQNSYATKTEIKNATITGEDIILSKNKGLTVEGSTIPGIRGEAFGNESDQTITITDSKVTDEIYWLNNTALTIDHSQVGKITAYGDQSRTVIQNGSVITGLVSGPGTKTITGSTIRGGSVKDSTVTNSTFTGTSTISGTSSLAGNSTVNGSVTIPSGSSLTVQKGAKLTVAAGASLTNNGTLINNGRIVNGGTVDNQGAYNGAEPEITGGGINAGFSHEYYSVIVNQAKNGTVSANMTSASVNSLVTLTVTPADNYVLNTLTVITGTGAQVTVENNTFRMPRASVTVTATFRPKDYSIATASMSHGNVTVQATARYGDTVPVTVIPDTGYVLSSLTVMRGNTAVAVTNNTFVMPAGNVTVSAAFAPDPKDFKLTGVNEYTILTETGWNVFCDCLEDNDTWNRFSGMTVKLGANISVSRMAGSSKHDFCGIFDGNYHTLTFNYGTADAHSTDSYVAPFSYVSNTKANPSDTNDTPVVIRNLRVCGDIYTSGQQAGGIIAREWGTVSITNCRVSINIHSSTVGDGTHGGFVAVNNSSATLNIEGCVFDGSLLGSSTNSCGGFVGWKSGTVKITNCIFAPSDTCTIDSNDSYTFSRRSGTVSSSYYTVPFGAEQGEFIGQLTLPEGVTASAAEGDTVDYDNKTWYIEGKTVTLTVTPEPGYKLSSLTVTQGDTAVTVTDDNTFIMPAGDVTVNAEFILNPEHFEKTGNNEYTIWDGEGWNMFCDCLENNDTWNRFSGKTVKLGANISVSRMAGSSKHDFCGIFDGNYHTLTFNYGTADAHSTDSYVAPFSYVSNTKANPSDTNDTPVVIRNLRVCGDIYTSGQQAGGIIAREWGTVSITNCRVSINIHSSTVGDGTHGGLVACINNGSLTIEGCVFDGSLLGNSTDSCGGFIGWRAGSAVIRNSLFTPDNVTVLSSGSATFARNKVDTYNSYYTSLLNDGTNYAPFLADATVSPAKWNNGMASLTVTTEDEYVTTCTVSPVGDDSQTYSVSGITAYDNGIVRGETFYYGQGDNVNITLSAAEREGYACTGFTASAGTMSGGSSPYTLTMPDADVTVSANYISYWAELQAMINDSDGTGDSPTTIKLTQDYTATSTDTALQIPSGKYIVLDLDGHTIDRGLTSAKADGNVFTVEGNLTVTDSSENQSGAIKGGNNTGNGGGVVVNGGTFNLNGGSVSGNDGGFSGGGVYISSGTFNMTGGTISGNTAGYNGGGVYSTGRLRVSGTPVITGNVKGGTIVNGQLTGGTTQNVYMPGSYGIVVTGALTDTASIGVTMENPGVFADYDRNYTLTDSDLARFTSDSDDYCIRMNDDHRGVLRACYAISIAAAEHGTVTASVNGESATKAAEGDTVTLTVTPTEDFVLAANGLRVSWTDEDNAEYDVAATQGTGNDADKWSFEMPDHNVTVSAVFIPSTFGKPDFTLPAQLTTIEESAFEGDTLITVVDASNCSSIGAYAFKDTGLTQIRLDKDCEIAENAFSGCGTVYVFVQAGGKTKTFCDTHEGIEFVAIDSID